MSARDTEIDLTAFALAPGPYAMLLRPRAAWTITGLTELPDGRVEATMRAGDRAAQIVMRRDGSFSPA